MKAWKTAEKSRDERMSKRKGPGQGKRGKVMSA